MEKFNLTNPTYYTRDAVNGIIQPRTLTDLFQAYRINGLDIKNNGTNTLDIALGKTVDVDENFYVNGGQITLSGNGLGSQIAFPTGVDTLVGQASVDTITGLKTLQHNNIVVTSHDGLVLTNDTNATAGVPVQMSPRLRFRGSAWDTDDATSRTSDWIMENLPATGNTVSSTLKFGHSLAGASYTYPMTLNNLGYLTVGANIYVANGAGLGTSTINNGIFYPGLDSRGNLIQRNVADAYATQTINNLHASSTGNILDLQWQSVNRISFTKNGSINLNTTDALGAGTININRNRYFHAYGTGNLFIGNTAGNFTISAGGDYNIGLGDGCLGSLTSGTRNVALGSQSLPVCSTGNYNNAIGRFSLVALTTGSSNTANGQGTLSSIITTSDNTAMGYQALYYSTVANLTAVGSTALYYNTTGTGLVAMGYQAGYKNVKGTNNSYFGYQAGYSGTTVVNSIAITNGGTGYTAGNLIVDNTGTGGSGLAGTYTVDGSGVINGITITNKGTGYNTVPVVTPQPGGSSAVLTPALASADGNTATGYNSLYNNTYGIYNTANGVQALLNNTTGYYNSAFGYQSLYSLSTGSNNSVLGYRAGRNQTSGDSNIYIGYESAYKAGVTATGSGNVFMGYQTGINNTASNNVFIGYQAGYLNGAGIGQTCVGYYAGKAIVTGNYLTAFGYYSLFQATGGGNTAIGDSSGYSLTTGTTNTFVGQNAGNSASQKVDATNSMALGYGAYTTASNQIVLGNASVTQILCGQDSQAEVKAGKLETTVAGEGIILKSPDGTRYKITVANDGTVTSTAV